MLNFPVKCFWNKTLTEVYSFYRQGQSFRINFDPNNILSKEPEIQYENLEANDLGTMFLIEESCLAVSSSQKVLFFKRILDSRTDIWYWTLYHKIDQKGMLYFINGNIRISITAEDKIHYYLINNKAQIPVLENVMYNFMKCTSLIFGSKVKYGVSYKIGQTGFEIYSKKYEHNFKVNVLRQNLEKSKGLSINSMNRILVTKTAQILVLDAGDLSVIEDECF